MKSKNFLTALVSTFALTALLDTASVTVNAANNNSDKTVAAKQVEKHYVIKNAPKISKWGYILNVNSSALPIFVGKGNYQKLLNNPYFKGTKNISPKKIKNVRFKVAKIMIFKNVNGTPEYLVTSKNHKYNAWTPNAGLQYYDIHSKSLQSVIRPLKRIKSRDFEGLNRKKTVKDTRSRITKNKRDFGLAVKAAKRLKGKQRKFVLGSLQQMRQDDGIRNVMQEKQDNVLLWTIN